MADHIDTAEEVWLVNGPDGTEVHDAESALYRLAALAYEGALPGTCVDRWWRQTPDDQWERDNPWEN